MHTNNTAAVIAVVDAWEFLSRRGFVPAESIGNVCFDSRFAADATLRATVPKTYVKLAMHAR